MVSIAPNQFQIEGIIESKKKDAALEHFVTLIVRLDKVKKLQGSGDFPAANSTEIAVSVSETVASELKEGVHLVCKIRKAPGHFFVLPNSIETKPKK